MEPLEVMQRVFGNTDMTFLGEKRMAGGRERAKVEMKSLPWRPLQWEQVRVNLNWVDEERKSR